MPVVTVAVPAVGEPAAVPGLLSDIADAAASVLGLGAGDVIAVHLPAGATVASGRGVVDAWPVVTVHGRDRGAAARVALGDAIEAVVRSWFARHELGCEGVWVSWSIATQ